MSNLLNETFQKHLNLLHKHLNEKKSKLLEINFSVPEAIEVLKRYGIANAINLTNDELKKIYRRLAAKFHPDAGGSHKDFININSAYETLKNAQKQSEPSEEEKRRRKQQSDREEEMRKWREQEKRDKESRDRAKAEKEARDRAKAEEEAREKARKEKEDQDRAKSEKEKRRKEYEDMMINVPTPQDRIKDIENWLQRDKPKYDKLKSDILSGDLDKQYAREIDNLVKK